MHGREADIHLPVFQAVVSGTAAEAEDEVKSALSACSVVEKRARPWVDQIVVIGYADSAMELYKL